MIRALGLTLLAVGWISAPRSAAGSPTATHSVATRPATTRPATGRVEAQAHPQRQRPKPKKTWRLILTPGGGLFKNVLRFTYEVPTGPGERTARTKELVDTSAGGALITTLINGRLALTNVTFLIPRVNRSRVLGSTLYGAYRHPILPWLDVFYGLGMVLLDIDGHYQDFEDTITKQGVSATARLDDIWVQNTVLAPFTRLGVRFNIPIQHWYVAPWVSYRYETFHIDIHSPGGQVYVPPPIDDDKAIPSIVTSKWKQYHSPIVGLTLRLDFHYALQLRACASYDLNHDKLAIRLVGLAFFSRRVPIGVALQFAYVEGIVHDNTYGFIGPSFLF